MVLEQERSVRLAKGLFHSRLCESREMPKPSNEAARAGIAYEKKVLNQLNSTVQDLRDVKIYPQTWFRFCDDNGRGQAVPDCLIVFRDEFIILIEIKLKFVPEAIEKLEGLYKPVVEMALGLPAHPLVICKYLTPEAEHLAECILTAIRTRKTSTLHWPGRGRIPWT